MKTLGNILWFIFGSADSLSAIGCGRYNLLQEGKFLSMGQVLIGIFPLVLFLSISRIPGRTRHINDMAIYCFLQAKSNISFR